MHSQEEYYHKADNLIRISCQAVQGVFRDNWKRITGSEWTEGSANDFISGHGKGFYSNCKTIQKRILEEGKVEEWDLTLLSGIFNLKCFSTEDHDDGSWKSKKAALQTLCAERNQLAHNAPKKLTAAAYQEVETTVRDSLSTMGISKKILDKWISQAGVTSSIKALEQARKIQRQGDKEYSKGNYQSATVHYDEALLVPSLLPANLCTLYEKRAECYLELGRREKIEARQTGFYDQAMKDVMEALSNNESSWRAHSILAKIYKAKNELDKTIEHLEKALAKSPSQANLKEELDDCKLVRGAMMREDHMDPMRQPKTLAEAVDYYSKSAGVQLTPETFLKCRKEIGDDLLPGQGDVFAGHEWANGWNVEKNFQEAARHFAKAMTKGNAEGIYNLALLYLEGNGVQKDIPYSIKLLKKAANMPEKIKLLGSWHVDIGVMAAQHALGLRYQEGVGVGQDYKKAVEWYTKATKLGCGLAANNLAILYHAGEGVTQDYKMAEMYWKKAAEQGNVNAAHSLCNYYIEEMEPKLAELWLEKAIQLGDNRLPFLKEDIQKSIDEISRMRRLCEINVSKFERDHGLSTQGLSFMQRQNRMMVAGVHQMAKGATAAKGSESAEKEAEECAENYAKFLEARPLFGPGKSGQSTQNSKLGWGGRFNFNRDHFEVISKRAMEGSITAQRVMTVYSYMGHFYRLWNENGPHFSQDRAKAVIDIFYEMCCREQHLFFFTSQEMEDEFKNFLKSQFETHCSKKGDLDKKLRLCYSLYAGDKGKQFEIQVLKEGIRRYPNEAVYYDMLSCVFGGIKEYKAGLDIANQGLDRFPCHVELLYNRAVHTRLLEDNDPTTSRSFYQDFIKAAPEDHRKIPEAYYCIAQTYLMEASKTMLKSGRKTTKKLGRQPQGTTPDPEDKVLEFYEMGKRAEDKQLPCYLPYESPSKALLVPLVMIIKAKSSPTGLSDNGEEKASSWGGKLPKFLTNISRDYLKDPKRSELVKAHRQNLQNVQKMNKENLVFAPHSKTPTFQHKLPEKLAGLQEIALQEMDPTQDKVYEGKILNLTLIEDPVMHAYPSIHMLAMDDNRETIRLYIYNVPHNEEIRRKLGFGCRLYILNPYLRICADKKNGIRVDEPKCIFYLDKVKNMCRYCGEENAVKKCSKCKWASYCNRECQLADWKELKHKLICKPTTVTEES